MLLRKIDGERTYKIVDFPQNCDGGDIHDQRQLSRTRTIIFDDMTHRWRQNLAGDDQATLMVDRKSTIDVCLR